MPQGKHRPPGVLAMSDMAAIGLMAAAQAAGVHVPDDLSIVGYDDLPMAAWTKPALTTVRPQRAPPRPGPPFTRRLARPADGGLDQPGSHDSPSTDRREGPRRGPIADST